MIYDSRCGRHQQKRGDYISFRHSKILFQHFQCGEILSKRLSIGRACALLGVVMIGPEIPLERAGHQDRVLIFKSAAQYCLRDEDLKDILDTEEAVLEFYLQGIYRAACRLPMYDPRTSGFGNGSICL